MIVLVWIFNLTCSNNIKLLVPNTCWFPITVGLVLCGRANTASFCSKHLLSSVIDFFVSHHCSLSVLKCLSTRLSFVCRPRGTCLSKWCLYSCSCIRAFLGPTLDCMYLCPDPAQVCRKIISQVPHLCFLIHIIWFK